MRGSSSVRAFLVSRVRAGDERGDGPKWLEFRKRYGDAMLKAGVPEQ